MEEKICRNCRYYRQHYGLDQRKLFRVYCGHCVNDATKRKRPDHIACEAFAPAEPDENAFASKEYLSKALLRYVLELELLPEIRDEADSPQDI